MLTHDHTQPSLSVQYATSAPHLPTRPQFRRWVRAVLQHDVQITLRIMDENEARKQRKNHAHLTIHAVLHLQGYEHEEESEAAAMVALELSRQSFRIPTAFGYTPHSFESRTWIF